GTSFIIGTIVWYWRGEAVLWWIVTCLLVAPIILITGLVAFGFVDSEQEQPYGLWHLALLPPASASIGAAIWWGVVPRLQGKASRLGHFLMWLRGNRGPVDEATATARLVNPIFVTLVIASACILALLTFLVSPVQAAHEFLVFRRSLLIPFFLGML